MAAAAANPLPTSATTGSLSSSGPAINPNAVPGSVINAVSNQNPNTNNLNANPAPVAQKLPGSKSSGEPRRVRFNVGSKYHVMDVIGKGAYGVVCSAVHRPTGQKVAIKNDSPVTTRAPSNEDLYQNFRAPRHSLSSAPSSGGLKRDYDQVVYDLISRCKRSKYEDDPDETIARLAQFLSPDMNMNLPPLESHTSSDTSLPASSPHPYCINTISLLSHPSDFETSQYDPVKIISPSGSPNFHDVGPDASPSSNHLSELAALAPTKVSPSSEPKPQLDSYASQSLSVNKVFVKELPDVRPVEPPLLFRSSSSQSHASKPPATVVSPKPAASFHLLESAPPDRLESLAHPINVDSSEFPYKNSLVPARTLSQLSRKQSKGFGAQDRPSETPVKSEGTVSDSSGSIRLDTRQRGTHLRSLL